MTEKRKHAGLRARLSDLANEVERLEMATNEQDGSNELLLARLLVDVDRVTSRLAKHRTALEAATK